jgi:hypothetical protein
MSFLRILGGFCSLQILQGDNFVSVFPEPIRKYIHNKGNGAEGNISFVVPFNKRFFGRKNLGRENSMGFFSSKRSRKIWWEIPVTKFVHQNLS